MANTSSIRAGRAFVELFADDSKLVRGRSRTGSGRSRASRWMRLLAGGCGGCEVGGGPQPGHLRQAQGGVCDKEKHQAPGGSWRARVKRN